MRSYVFFLIIPCHVRESESANAVMRTFDGIIVYCSSTSIYLLLKIFLGNTCMHVVIDAGIPVCVWPLVVISASPP